MSLYNALLLACLRGKDALQKRGIFEKLARLRREQYLPLADIRKLQSERLNTLLRHASQHSSYYRECLRKTGIPLDGSCSLDDLNRIPLLRRIDLQTHSSSILTTEHAVPNSSGGSTGNPVNFYQDEQYERASHASGLFFMEWMGIRPGDRTAVFWGADRDLRDLPLRERLLNRIYRRIQLNSFSMSDELIEEFIARINRSRPRYIYGYASSLYLVSKWINRTGRLKFVPRAVRSSAELLHDFQREEIEKAFGTPVYNFYGSREVNNLASECPAHAGLHINASDRIVEIVDENGVPQPAGKMGLVAVTDLTNLAFPFIRYLNGDMAAWLDDPCPCGRTFPRLERVYGRSSDMIIVGDQYIHGEYFTHIFYHRPEIKQFQIIQETRDRLVLLLVPVAGTVSNTADYLTPIREKVGPGIEIDVRAVDHIPTTPTGKYRFTISKIADTAIT